MRKIHFSGEEVWEYKIGKEFIEIRDPQRKKFVATKTHLLRTVLRESVSDAYRKVYSEWYNDTTPTSKIVPEIKPSHIKEFIQKEIKDAKNFSRVGNIRS